MSLAPELDRFREAIASRLGLWFDDAKAPLLTEVLSRRAAASSTQAHDYLQLLESREPLRSEVRELARELTVPETYFFRHADQFRAFGEVALPERLEARATSKVINVLSAGCSTGEEPYSLAIQMRQHQAAGWQLSVLGVDLNAASLEKAMRGRYSEWSLRDTPPSLRLHFTPEGRDLVLNPRIRASVRFEQHNLVTADATFWLPQHYDVVFCRNVLMYFTQEQARSVVDRLAESLVPGGFLFLGHAETLRDLSHDFQLLHSHDTFYYQRKGRIFRPLAEPRPLPPPEPAALRQTDPHWPSAWLDTVARSSERIRALTEGLLPDEKVTSSTGGSSPVHLKALELLKAERFSQALEVLNGCDAGDAQTLLLRAVLLTHSGSLNEAQQACGQLLALEQHNAGAQYLLGLCADGLGQLDEAVEHYQLAASLYPAFAMPRLHLGLLARRAGDRRTARSELEQALVLLQTEQSAQLLLYGGGFSQDSLVALCRAQIATLETSL